MSDNIDDPLNTKEIFDGSFLDDERVAEAKKAALKQADDDFEEEQIRKKNEFDKITGRLLAELYNKLQRLYLIVEKTSMMEQESLAVFHAAMNRLGEITYKKHRFTEEVEAVLARIAKGLAELKDIPEKEYQDKDVSEMDFLGLELNTFPEFIASLVTGMGHKMQDAHHLMVSRLHKISAVAEAKSLFIRELCDTMRDNAKKKKKADVAEIFSKNEPPLGG